MYFYRERGDIHLNAVYNFSSTSIHNRPDEGSKL
jgi:hypothetical protein